MSLQHNDQKAVVTLTAEPLTAAAFAPFGDVIEPSGPSVLINQGKGRRYNDLARVEAMADGGRVAISRVASVAETVPVRLRVMERHPLSSQAFVPMNGQRYLVVVARAGEPPAPGALRAFVAKSSQGINYHRGTWHHPIIGLDHDCEFLEVHRVGPGVNCDEVKINAEIDVHLPNEP